MKPVGVVTCLPSQQLEKSLTFYQECFGFPDLKIEDDMFVIELPGLSLFVMSEESYQPYARRAGREVGYPDSHLQSLHSCAIASQSEIEDVLASAAQFGGEVSQSLEQNEWGQQVAYVRDPDGHVWELVLVPEVAG